MSPLGNTVAKIVVESGVATLTTEDNESYSGSDLEQMMNKQLEAVGVVQHEIGGFDVNLYSKKFFRPVPLDCAPIIGMSDEVNVAAFYPINIPNSSLVAKLWFVTGTIFSIEFEGEPLPDENFTDWRCEILTPLDDFKEMGKK